MPASITHIYYAYKVKDILQVRNLNKFLIGNLFPDIRAIVPKLYRLTHPRDVEFKNIINISNNNDFIKGWLFHSWLDYMHLSVILENKRLFPHGFCRSCASAYKFRQDLALITAGLIDASLLNLTIESLQKVYTEELVFLNNKFTIIKWHHILINYFKNMREIKDFKYTVLQFLIDTGVQQKVIKQFFTYYKRFSRFPETSFLTRPIDKLLK